MLLVVGQVLVEVGERAGVGRERVVRRAVGVARRLLIEVLRGLVVDGGSGLARSHASCIHRMHPFHPPTIHPSMHCGLAAEAREVDDEEGGDVVPVRGLARRFSALGGPLERWRVASKRLGALPRIRRGAQGRGCGREGSGALPQARAAVISTGLRLRLHLSVREVAVVDD